MIGQLLAHLWGDYLLQSDWLAQNKTKSALPAWVHALVYSFPFLLFTGKAPNPALAGTTILVTHFLIDRYRVARYLCWAKNWLGPWKYMAIEIREGESSQGLSTKGRATTDFWSGHQPTPPWRFCSATGYPPTVPPWMAVWLMIIADNTLHLTCNYIALRWL